MSMAPPQTFESCKGLAEFLGKQVCLSQDRPVSGHVPPGVSCAG
jgi:hypothetical protein